MCPLLDTGKWQNQGPKQEAHAFTSMLHTDHCFSKYNSYHVCHQENSGNGWPSPEVQGGGLAFLETVISSQGCALISKQFQGQFEFQFFLLS